MGALFQGAWQNNPHFCTASVVDSPSGDVIATAGRPVLSVVSVPDGKHL